MERYLSNHINFISNYSNHDKTVKDVIIENNGNIKIIAFSEDKITHIQRRNWSKYENDTKYYEFFNPISNQIVVHVLKK